MTFYGVWAGREIGVFTDWKTCSKQINGFKGAKFKKLAAQNKHEAQVEFDKGYTPAKKSSSSSKGSKTGSEGGVIKNLHKTGELVYFCDGACQKNPGPSASGIATYRHGNLDSLVFGGYEVEGSNNISELKALAFCLHQINNEKPFAAIIYADSMYAIKAVTEWSKNWSKNNWKKANNSPVVNRELIEDCYNLYEALKGTVEIRHVKAHIGEEGNELADRMAIYASLNKTDDWFFYEHLNIDEILKISY